MFYAASTADLSVIPAIDRLTLSSFCRTSVPPHHWLQVVHAEHLRALKTFVCFILLNSVAKKVRSEDAPQGSPAGAWQGTIYPSRPACHSRPEAGHARQHLDAVRKARAGVLPNELQARICCQAWSQVHARHAQRCGSQRQVLARSWS